MYLLGYYKKRLFEYVDFLDHIPDMKFPDWIYKEENKRVIEDYYNRFCEVDYIHTKIAETQRISSEMVAESEKKLQETGLCHHLITLPSVNKQVLLKGETIRIDVLVVLINPNISVKAHKQYSGYNLLVDKDSGFINNRMLLSDQFISPDKFKLLLLESISEMVNQRSDIQIRTSDCSVILNLSVPNVVNFDLCLIPCITSGPAKCESVFLFRFQSNILRK